MVVAIARAEFHLPTARSLKDKRRFLKSLVDRLHSRLRISIAETGHQDLWQRTEIGLAFVHTDRAVAERKLEDIHRLFEDQSEAHLATWDAECLEESA